MYADGVVFYVPRKDLKPAELPLQSDCDNVYKWFSTSGLCVNMEKTTIWYLVKIVYRQ